MAWVRVTDVIIGPVVLSLDGEQVAMFPVASYDTYRLHIAIIYVEVSGPDAKNRYRAMLSTQQGGRGPSLSVTVDEHDWPALKAWVDAVRAAQAALPPPLA